MRHEDIIELFNERSAIKEHCGRMSKLEAEKQAWYEIKKRHGLTKCPDEIVAAMKRTMKEWDEANKVVQKELFERGTHSYDQA